MPTPRCMLKRPAPPPLHLRQPQNRLCAASRTRRVSVTPRRLCARRARLTSRITLAVRPPLPPCPDHTSAAPGTPESLQSHIRTRRAPTQCTKKRVPCRIEPIRNDFASLGCSRDALRQASYRPNGAFRPFSALCAPLHRCGSTQFCSTTSFRSTGGQPRHAAPLIATYPASIPAAPRPHVHRVAPPRTKRGPHRVFPARPCFQADQMRLLKRHPYFSVFFNSSSIVVLRPLV